MAVNFITPTRLSLLDITSMGDSSKRDDTSTIGQFDSGLKYAIALLLRNDVDISIGVYGGEENRGDWEEEFIDYFSFKPYTKVCESTGKEKDLIKVEVTTEYQGGDPQSQHEMREPSPGQSYSEETGFAKALGHNWELWMALRELWSNMLDEGGTISLKQEGIKYGTIVSLTFDEDNPFYKVWEERHLYINEKEPLYKISNRVEALENKENYLRVYKQNILIYEDKEVPSRFAYNIKFGEIDERRILSNIHSVEGDIVSAILNSKNKEYLKQIISSTFEADEKEFLSRRTPFNNISDLINEIVTECYKEYNEVKSYDWIIRAVRERKDCQIGGKIINTVGDSLWDYNSKVSVETPPCDKTEEDSIDVEIERKFNFKIDVEIKRASLKGSKVIADMFNKTLILDYEFKVESNMSEFFVQYLELTREGNVVKNLGDYIVEILTKQ